MTISAVVLTKNSEDTIKACISSLSWCTEIIVVDDYSSDATVRIAKKSGAILFFRKLENDFAAQRNFALAKARSDWVFFVDADEQVTQELTREILQKIETGTAVGFKLKRSDFFLGRRLAFGETGKIRLTRLGKKGFGLWERPIHEEWQLKGVIGNLALPLIHHPHSNLAGFLSKINWYTTLNAHYFNTQGVTSSWFEILLFPPAKFLKNYFFLGGFLDGMEGFIHALCMSFHSFLTRAKLYLLQNKFRSS
ncbi:glycosyltransferase family 2 protein [Candidatus Woesebacteria bacterium]|nr:glycosyltransferase family 2 protein [Candidatus Woesebacteria bacterium]